MVKFLCILILILTSSLTFGQDLSKTKTAKEITMRKDTIGGKIIEQTVFRFKKDSVFINEQRKNLSKIDSLIDVRKKKK
jgi:hypothetical protein